MEEETIDKGDLVSSKKTQEEKIKELEKALADEKKRVEVLEQDSNKLFEAEEQLVIVKDELDTLREELNVTKVSLYEFRQQHS